MNDKQKKKYDELKIFIESKGGKLISKEYVDSKTELEFICAYSPCKKPHKATFTKIKASNACCPGCRYERSRDKLSKSQTEIENIFIANRCVLYSKYINCDQLLLIKCSCGSLFYKSYQKCKENGFRCISCARLIYSEYNLQYSLRFFKENNCKVLFYEKFNGCWTKFKFVCSCGRTDVKKLKYFYNNPNCRYCSQEKDIERLRSQNKNKTLEEVKFIIESKSNCKLLNESYENRDTLLTLKCECGNNFNTYLDRFEYENKRQCNECGIKSRSGENAPRWKGGITPENQKIRHSKEYIQWRDSVFERDNYTCQACRDNKGGNLQAHHIENFSDNEDKRFELDNGITLCNNCHNFSVEGSFHYEYGTHNNNREQLNDYIKSKQPLITN